MTSQMTRCDAIWMVLRQVERALALFDGHAESVPEDVLAAVVGELEVVDACHYAGEIVVWSVGRFAGAADDGEDGS